MKVLEKSGNTPFQVVFGFLCSIWEKQSRVEGAKPTSRCWACGRDTFYHTWGHKFPRGRAWFHSAALCTLAHRDRHHWCGSTSHHSHTCRSLHNAAHSSPRGTHPGTCEVKKNPINKQKIVMFPINYTFWRFKGKVYGECLLLVKSTAWVRAKICVTWKNLQKIKPLLLIWFFWQMKIKISKDLSLTHMRK